MCLLSILLGAHKERWGFHVFRPAVVTRSPTRRKSLCQSPCCQRTFVFALEIQRHGFSCWSKTYTLVFPMKKVGKHIFLFSQTLFSSGITNILGYLLVKKQHPDSFGKKFVASLGVPMNYLKELFFLFLSAEVGVCLLVKKQHPFWRVFFSKKGVRTGVFLPVDGEFVIFEFLKAS